MPEIISIAPVEELEQDELQEEKPMSYNKYSELLQEKLTLHRQLHTSGPSESRVIRRNIQALELRLSKAPREYMDTYRRNAQMIG